ncbi:MAG: ricin-type beta-trefoil lectin domain protein [Catenulispora sp.]|nr:ricin-type beta-trefoil lectin domain protein [Catenulispora sp.]
MLGQGFADSSLVAAAACYREGWNGGSISGTQIYDNTSYWNPATSTDMAVYAQNAALTGTNFFKNNAIYSTGSVFTWVQPGLTFDNNDYWYTGSGSPQWFMGNTPYASLAAWQAGSGQDTHSQYANPLLASPTTHSTGWPTTAFVPQAGSPLINAGASLGSMGSSDFLGNPLPSSGPYTVGAVQSGTATGELHAVGAGRCLDVPGAATTPGTQVDIWDCAGSANQVWTHTSGGQLTVYSGSTLMCLDAWGHGTTNGTIVDVYTCNGGANQQWTINANGTITGVQSGLCLDVANQGTANGTPVQLYSCNGGSNQQWALQ